MRLFLQGTPKDKSHDMKMDVYLRYVFMLQTSSLQITNSLYLG